MTSLKGEIDTGTMKANSKGCGCGSVQQTS